MSLGRPNPYEYLSPAEYQANQVLIKQAKGFIKTFENMTEAGRKKFQDRESQLEQARRDLQRKIEEGEQARRLLEQLETQQSSGSTSQDLVPFSSARIEEVATNSESHNQHASRSHSTSPPINAGPQRELQPRQSTQYEPSRNLGGHSSPWIPSPGQQPASYYGQPFPPQYRPLPTEQPQQHDEALPSQNTAGAFRFAYPHPAPNMRPTPVVPSQPYGSAYGHPQQSMSDAQTSSTQPFPFYNPPRPGQQYEGQVNNNPYHTAAFSSTSTPGSFSQANNRKASTGHFPTSSNAMSLALDADAHQPSHVLPKPTNFGRTIQNPPSAARIMSVSDKLSEIADYYADKLSIDDIRRNLEGVKKWKEQALPGAISNFLALKLVKDQQGEVQLQLENYLVDFNLLYRALMVRKGVVAKPNSALPVEANPPVHPPIQPPQPRLDNIQRPNPPTATVSSISGAIHPTATSTTPAPANLSSQATSTTTVPIAAIPPRPSQTTSNPVPLPSPSQANKKHLAQDILFALGKRKQRPSASDSTEQPTKKRVPEPSTSSAGRFMEFAVNGTPPRTAQVSSKASELDKLVSRRPSTIATPAQEPPEGNLPSISKAQVSQARPVPTAVAPTPYAPYGVFSSKAVPQTAKVPGSGVLSSSGFQAGVSSLSRTASTTPMVSEAGRSSSSGPSKVAPLPLTQPIVGPSASGPSKTGPSTQTMTSAPATSGLTSSSMSHPLGPVPLSRTSSGSGNSPTAPLSIPSPSPLVQTTVAPVATSGSGGLSQPAPPFQTAPLASTSIVAAGGTISSQPPVSVSSSGAKPTQPSVIGLASPARKDSSQVQREPLFLPSSVSPEPEPFQISDRHTIGANEASSSTTILDPTARLNRQGAKRMNFAYVLLPPPPEYLIRDRRRGEGRRSQQSVASGSDAVLNRLRKDGTRTSSVSTSLVGEEDYDKIESRRDRSVDKDELRAVLLSCSRLQELPCRWDGCDVKMNSVDSLIRHLNQHKPRASSNNPYFTCRWTQCGRRCTFKEKHLEKHATLPLQCAYEDCDDSFRTAGQLVKHFQVEHTDDVLKPVAGILVPRLETPPPAPETVPSYMLVTRAVLPQKISQERHKLLIPWVVRNIVSSDHEVRAAKRARKTARPINRDTLPGGGPSTDYEFLETRSTRYSTWLSRPVDIKLDDLDSAEVSRMVDEGLLLWGPGEVGIFGAEGRGNINDADPPKSPLLTPTQPPAELLGVEVPRSGTSRDNGHSSDEDMVEDMLRGTPLQ